MTIEQLLGMSSKEYDELGVDGLEKILAPYIKKARPNVERIEKMKMKNETKPKKQGIQSKMKLAQDILKLVEGL